MKRTIFIFLLATSFFTTYAQVDAKINPLGTLFGNPDVSAEFAVSNNFGVETGIGLNLGKFEIGDLEYKRSGIGAFAAGKYYFNPKDGVNGFGVGLYSRFRKLNNKVSNSVTDRDNYTRTRLATGLQLTWKWVGDNGVLFELDLGGGRTFVNNISFDNEESTTISIDDVPTLNIDLLLRLAVGYRFGG